MESLRQYGKIRSWLDDLKILPWQQEINKQVIFRGERLYEESLGDIRFYIQDLLSQFEAILAKQDQKKIDSFRKELIKVLLKQKGENKIDMGMKNMFCKSILFNLLIRSNYDNYCC